MINDMYFMSGIWDLTRIRYAIGRCFSPLSESLFADSCSQFRHTSDMFNHSHVAFEHAFTIMGRNDSNDVSFSVAYRYMCVRVVGSIAGLNVAYLPAVMFLHIGEEESAYTLNNFTRPWHSL